MPDASRIRRHAGFHVLAGGMAVLALLLLLGVAEPGPPSLASPDADPDTTHIGNGTASYYGAELAGRPTASGEPFDPSELTAAHRTLPFGSKLRVTNLRNGRTVVVRVNDRGPFARRRIIDLSYAAAQRLGMVQTGTVRVRLDLLH
jgi:rare lipoprotein A